VRFTATNGGNSTPDDGWGEEDEEVYIYINVYINVYIYIYVYICMYINF
jgi:hypothetical protein